MIDSTFISKLESLVTQADAQIHDISGAKFSRSHLHEIEPTVYTAEPLRVSTLQAVVDYLSKLGMADELDFPFIHVMGPSRVMMISGLNERRGREVYIDARAQVTDFLFGRHMPIDEFLVGLKTSFVGSDTIDQLTRIVGKISWSDGIKVSDDGVTQIVTTKTGVEEYGTVLLDQPVYLAPYRTFPEIEQPMSPYIYRVSNDSPMAKLVEVDDKTWTIEAVNAIKTWLREAGVDVPIIG